MRWNPADDTLVFDIHHICKLATEMEPTKRKIVGIASRFYDPLRILSPITVRFKLMFQDLCVKELNWDDQLSGEHLVEVEAQGRPQFFFCVERLQKLRKKSEAF